MVIVNVVLSPLIARYSCLERVALKTAWRISCPAMPTTVHVYEVPPPKQYDYLYIEHLFDLYICALAQIDRQRSSRSAVMEWQRSLMA